MFKNIGSNWLLLLLALLGTSFLMPFNLRILGREQYGVWLLISSMTGYLGLLLLGVPMASVRYIARSHALNDHVQMNQIINSCAGLYIGMGFVSFLAGIGLLLLFNRTYAIPTALERPAHIAFLLLLLYIAGGFFGQLPNGILHAHQAFVLRNGIQAAMWVLRIIITVVLVYRTRSLLALAVTQLTLLVLEMAVLWTVVLTRYPYIRLSLGLCEWSTVRRIFSFSMFVMLLSIGNQLSFQTDSLVIGRYLSVDQIPFYAVANSMCLYLIEFVVGVAAVVMPMAAKLDAEDNPAELRNMFLKWSKVTFSIAIFAATYLIAFGGKVISLWVGPVFEAPSGSVLKILMISNLVFVPARGVCLPVLMGVGKPQKATIAFIGAGVLNLVLSVLFVDRWGLPGVAWGTALPNIGFAIVAICITCRQLQIRMREYMQYVVLRATVGALPVFAVVLWMASSASVARVGTLAAQAILTFAALVITWTAYVYRKDRYVDANAWLMSLRNRMAHVRS